MKPDLSQYEDCATLNRWFQLNYPMGALRIMESNWQQLVDAEGHTSDEVYIVVTGCFRDGNDDLPATMNVARGLKSEYPKHMQKFFVEDTTTSSYARTIALLKATDKTATKEGMTRVQTWAVEPKAELDQDLLQPKPTHSLTREVENLTEIHCDGGQRMLYKAGISKTTGKPFAGYVCVCGQKCDPVWGSPRADGTFVFKETING